ncbi:hypothetical protein T440DRAFT_509533 [Plenodomus tracheiphilus IPT5]|uniref:Uncharacterized protein n=1 Tax=Plenodomus tracheiphilus IPT5 TaxID=1408161 RepID=A0A6A7B022_9PLEO|nr:hypothetical protein T440DRAFT_509533 [Plenodomus tracheiphilus IPT5]
MSQQHIPPTAIEFVPEAPISPPQDLDITHIPVINDKFAYHYDSPLYTEINIPLPHVPIPKVLKPSEHTPAPSQPQTSSSTSRCRSRTLSSILPFHRRNSSSDKPKDAEEWPRIRKDIVKSKETHAMMDLAHHSKKSRRGTIDALAVVPAVLVLSAELFTPGTGDVKDGGRRKDSGVGRWEDGIR